MSSIMRGLVDEGMPSSIIKHKNKLGSMKDDELRSHFERIAKTTGKTPEEVARQTAWRHGYGHNSDHYWKRVGAPSKTIDEVAPSKPSNDNPRKSDQLQMAYKEALEITKDIKYDSTPSDIIVKITMLAEKVGLTDQIEMAADAVREAQNALESAVYGLDEVFKEAYQEAKWAEEDAENDLDEEQHIGLIEGYSDKLNSYIEDIKKQFPQGITSDALQAVVDKALANSTEASLLKHQPNSTALRDLKKDIIQGLKGIIKRKSPPPRQAPLWRQVGAAAVDQMEYAVGESFPDGDPRDIVIPWIKKKLRRAGIDELQLEREVYDAWSLAEKLFKKRNGTDYDGYMAQVWDDQAGDNPNGVTAGRENPWKQNESLQETGTEPQWFKKYPVTYVKLHKNKRDPNKVDYAEIRHVDFDLGPTAPKEPERVKHLIDISPKNKELKAAGYQFDGAGHKTPTTWYTYPVKIVKDDVLGEEWKRHKSRDTIVLRPEEYVALKKAKMAGKFNYDFAQKPGTNEVKFKIPKDEQIKFCKDISRIVDFGTTTASEVFGFDPVKFVSLYPLEESSIMKGIQSESSKEMSDAQWAKTHGHRAGKKGSPHTDNPYDKSEENHKIWLGAWKKARGTKNEGK